MSKADSFIVWLKESAYNAILIEALRQVPYETGGVLIGYWGNYWEAVVTEVIGPGPEAIHKKRSFVPDHIYHEHEIEKSYSKSGRTETYLGDWHTHPKTNAYLSSQDKSTIYRIADHEEARLEKPLMIILGTRPFGLSAWIHYYSQSLLLSRRKIVECSIKLY